MSKKVYDFAEKLNFVGEWFDYAHGFLKTFVVKYYPSDNTVELYEPSTRKMFLKRTKLDELTMDDMFVGSTIRIYGRQIKLTGYFDCRTQNNVAHLREKTLVILKPNVIQILGEIINVIQEHNFAISRLIMCVLNRKQALEFYEKRKGENVLPFILENVVSGPIVVMELVAENAVQRGKELMGPENPIDARKVAPNSLRAIHGKDSQATNGFHISLTVEDGISESNYFFGQHKQTPEPMVLLDKTTCCVIKPHAILEGKLGYIITAISESHFKITGAQMIYLSSLNADEFLEVYKGVVTDYHAFMLSFLEGPCVVLEIAAKNSEMDVRDEFRKFAGPLDSDIAKQIRPNTLRAKFGCDKYKNAVHCTDLPEDTILELEYLFKVVEKI